MMMTEMDRGALIPLDRIYPNRLNPNEMDRDDLFILKGDVKVDNYDPITVSPLGVFYTPEAREDPRVTAVIPDDADPETTYIICDGFHRYTTATQLKLTHIRGNIRHMTEKDAMPYFYRRHKLRGNLDPIKEAELFRSEMDDRVITYAELVKVYNLKSVNYIKARLALLNVTTDVVDLYYETPEGLPGKLSTEHLRALSFIPKNMQFAVAMMALERNWRVEDIRAEVKRIREGKGLRASEATAPGAPPPSYPTMAQRYLHPNIDRLLTTNEEKVVRFLKKRGELTQKDLVETLHLSAPTISKIIRDLTALEILILRHEKRKGRGRRKQFVKIWVESELPKSEYVRKTPLTDKELLEQYPEVYQKMVRKKTTTVGEKKKAKKKQAKRPTEPVRVGEARPVPIAPDAWRDNPIPTELVPPPERRPSPTRARPFLVLDQELIEDFAEVIYEMAIVEGLDVNSRNVDGKPLELWLEDQMTEILESWKRTREQGRPVLKNLAALAFRACQLHTRLKHERYPNGVSDVTHVTVQMRE